MRRSARSAALNGVAVKTENEFLLAEGGTSQRLASSCPKSRIRAQNC
jgi:hypothetical protein